MCGADLKHALIILNQISVLTTLIYHKIKDYAQERRVEDRIALGAGPPSKGLVLFDCVAILLMIRDA